MAERKKREVTDVILGNINRLIDEREGGSVTDFCVKIAVNTANYYTWVKRDGPPDAPTQRKICEIYGVSMEWLGQRHGIDIDKLKLHNIGWKVVKLCQEHGTTPVSVMSKLEIDEKEFESWGKGIIPNAENLIKILDHFGTSEYYLWDDDQTLAEIAQAIEEHQREYSESIQLLVSALTTRQMSEFKKVIETYKKIWTPTEEMMKIFKNVGGAIKDMPEITKMSTETDIMGEKIKMIKRPITKHQLAEQAQEATQELTAYESSRLLSIIETMQTSHAQAMAKQQQIMEEHSKITQTLAEAQRDGLKETNKAIQETNRIIQDTNQNVQDTNAAVAKIMSEQLSFLKQLDIKGVLPEKKFTHNSTNKEQPINKGAEL